MSRVGRLPILIPAGVSVELKDKEISVSKNNQKMVLKIHPDIEVVLNDNRIIVNRPSNMRAHRALHGLTRNLIYNMVNGINKPFEKNLEIVGVGYKAEVKGKDLELALGYSHPVKVNAPEGIEFSVDKQRMISIKGFDKQLVGEIAAEIRNLRKPEPYKGKGIKYANEHIRRKVGKSGATVGGK